jgi:hypothetical protein
MHATCACYAAFGLTNAAPPQLIMATPADDGSITQIFTVPENAKPGESVELLMPDGKRFMFEVRIRTNDPQRARPPTAGVAPRTTLCVLTHLGVISSCDVCSQIPSDATPGEKINLQVPKEKLASADTSQTEVTIPEGAKPGDKVLVEFPNGQKIEFAVPQGAAPGSKINLKVRD